jgi:hypothetical protein
MLLDGKILYFRMAKTMFRVILDKRRIKSGEVSRRDRVKIGVKL